MEWLLANPAVLARFQFAMTVLFHFLFVPMSIGLGLIMAIAQTRYYRSRDPEDGAAARFWVKIFTATFAVGVATGITMEFAFGTNWADYSRFVGDIFGAPLAAEALLAFFLESSFLGVILFAQKKVSPRFYMVSSWLVWCGSALSALWILIANSWMQTPAGYEVVDGKAVLTDFWAAAFNPSIGPRYFHTVIALLIFGAFIAVAVGAYHMLHGNKSFGKKTLATASVVALVTCIAMMPAMHQQAVEVANYQPEKLAAMEGQWADGPMNMSLIGWVDEGGKTTMTLDVPIAGMTSWLASGNATTTYPGLNSYDETDIPPVQATYQSYHLMVAMFGLIMIFLIVALIAGLRKNKEPRRGTLKFLMWSPLAPILAIMAGWMVTEVGRQPWIVWHELRTEDAISKAVDSTELLITICIFIVIYAIILIAYLRIVLKTIKQGPVLEAAGEKGAAAAMSGDKAAKGGAAGEKVAGDAAAKGTAAMSGDKAVKAAGDTAARADSEGKAGE